MRRQYWGASLLLILLLGGCTSVSNEEAAEAYYNLGNAYFDLGRLNESKRAYQRALELDPSLAAATYNLARLYIEDRRFDEAEEILLALVGADEENTLLYETLGWLEFRRGNNRAAAQRYRQALDLAEGNAAVWYNLGRIHEVEGELTEAVEAYRKAVYYEPDTLLYRTGLGEVYYLLEDYIEAVDLLYPAFSLGNRDLQLIVLLVKNLTSAEEYPAALEVADAGMETWETQRPEDQQNEIKAEILFYKSFTLLVGFENTAEGLSALRESIDSGFDDADKLALFYRYPDIPGFEEIQELLEDKKLAPKESPAPKVEH
ncbi:tetratricopeptide repeat protein [Marispirochaeta aestuarii]|uniref:tetratricopeptide repeat protein n=1 Tax=Marispirochaeta aestuarii TaxID=1963862 RepID=UPI0029C81E9C|nr:tetratricopeptide repeat protein [Marispirochaeta aestuarii]